MSQSPGEIYKDGRLKDLLEDCKKKAEKADMILGSIYLPEEVFYNASQAMIDEWGLKINHDDVDVIEISGTMRYMI